VTKRFMARNVLGHPHAGVAASNPAQCAVTFIIFMRYLHKLLKMNS